MKVHRGKTHKYLGMLLDFSHANQCRVTMIDYIDEIVVAYYKALTKLSDGFSAVNSLSAKSVLVGEKLVATYSIST
jgi:hypothetical protein